MVIPLPLGVLIQKFHMNGMVVCVSTAASHWRSIAFLNFNCSPPWIPSVVAFFGGSVLQEQIGWRVVTSCTVQRLEMPKHRLGLCR